MIRTMNETRRPRAKNELPEKEIMSSCYGGWGKQLMNMWCSHIYPKPTNANVFTPSITIANI